MEPRNPTATDREPHLQRSITLEDPVGIMKDRSAFFRRGSSGAGRELLTAGELARYDQRAAAMAPADLLAWLHR